MSLTDEETLELHELLDGLVENNLSAAKKARLITSIPAPAKTNRKMIIAICLSFFVKSFINFLII